MFFVRQNLIKFKFKPERYFVMKTYFRVYFPFIDKKTDKIQWGVQSSVKYL